MIHFKRKSTKIGEERAMMLGPAFRWGDQGGPPRQGDIEAKGGRNWSWEDLERRFHGEGTARAKVLRWESVKSV